MSRTIFAYTNPAGTCLEAFTVVREANGDLFVTVAHGSVSKSCMTLPRAHAERLGMFLGGAEPARGEACRIGARSQAVVKERPQLHVVETGQGLGFAGVLASSVTERAAAIGQAPKPAFIVGDPGDEDPPTLATEGAA
jgi:hypothetical protein